MKLNASSTKVIGERLIGYVSVFSENHHSPPTAPSGEKGGALKAAFTRAEKHNRRQTTTSLEKGSG